MNVAQAAQRRVEAIGDPAQVVLAVWMRDPVVARKASAALEQRRRSVDDRGIGDAELLSGLHVAGDELLVRYIRLQRDVRTADLRIAARVGLEQRWIDPADGLEQRGRALERWGLPELENDEVRRKLEARRVVEVQQEHAVLRHHVTEAIGEQLDICMTRG